MNKIKKGNKGFTLLELLVVVLIIGILAAIAIPQYKMAVGKAKFATLKNDVQTIKNALERYYLVQDQYTKNISYLDVEIENNCHIDGLTNPIIHCDKDILGSTMSYRLGYDKRNHLRACYITSNPLNPQANKLCQLETGRTKPNENNSDTYKAYYYK